MQIDILTVLPEMVTGALEHSIVKRARERGLITINVVNLRDFTHDRHKTTDDLPYGGGGGMIMKIEPIALALAFLTAPIEKTANTEHWAPTASPEGLNTEHPIPGVHPLAGRTEYRTPSAPLFPDFETESTQIAVNEVNYTTATDEVRVDAAEGEAGHGVPSQRQDAAMVFGDAAEGTGGQAAPIGSRSRPRIVLTDPRGTRFTQSIARQWAQEEHLILLCGHYEGVDERVRQHLVTDEISIGDFILTGGELPALLIADALARLQAGALGDAQAPDKDTFEGDLLEYPHYTRPRDFQGWGVPAILLCGHHAQIERWRRWHQLRATRERRPDLFARLNLSPQDWQLLNGEEPTAPPDSKAAAHKLPAPGRVAGTEQAAPDEARFMENDVCLETNAFESKAFQANATFPPAPGPEPSA